ncbi:MAG: DUF2344 domain-containing protein [Deltaproteobacteria bacterium]|nr:DUF2344 domain-containing protein [Deltaproteobacteria bacterium]
MLIKESLRNTGYDEVALLSLSTGDYSCIQGLITGLMNYLVEKKVAISLPSLRVGTLSTGLAEEIKRVRKTGFTLAPEAGTDRLRRIINKGMDEEEFIETTRKVFSLGWQSIKLYYMIGLPGETRLDLEGITELSRRVQEAGRSAGKRPHVNVSISTFVPKPHTPFQWEPQITMDECMERQVFLRKGLKRHRLEFKTHDARMGLLEGVFSRGDRRLSRVIKRAFELGCRFDGWGEVFRFNLWEQAFKETGLDMAFYTYRGRGREEVFPWDHLSSRVDKDFLYEEYEKALRAQETPDCRVDRCSVCGVCDHKVIKNVTSLEMAKGLVITPRHGRRPKTRVRLRFSKTGEMRHLSHLEVIATFTRAIRRASLPIRYSQGFHPLPSITFTPPQPVGVESIAEYTDLELEGYLKAEELTERLGRELPEGFKVLDARMIPLKLPPLSTTFHKATYLISLQNGSLAPDVIEGLIQEFISRKEIVITQKRDGKERRVDIRPLIEGIALQGNAIALTLSRGEGGSAKPHEVVEHLLNLPGIQAQSLPILKICEQGKTRY